MNRIAILLFVAATSLTGFVQAQSNIGHINFQELLAAMPEAKGIQSNLESYGTELQTTYDQYLGELQTRQTDYQTNAAAWSEVKREAAEQDIQSLVSRIEEFQLTSQEKLVNKQNELMNPLVEKAQAAVDAVGKEKGLTYVMDSSSLLFIGAGATDLLPAVKVKLGI